ncbi:hypothetical protein ACIRVF_39100 [Kitasatospora sp. NPDC101157]|uniref:hypothetical protein n=1 Tax=Kitasatospora sp. NPDC101157 TaxID=3364098 RepID=UPI00382C3CB0
MTRTIDLDRLLEAAGPAPDARPRYDLEAGRRHIADRQATRRAAAASRAPPRPRGGNRRRGTCSTTPAGT